MEKPDAKPRRQRKKNPVEWVDKGPKDTKVVVVNPSQFLMLKPEQPTTSNAEPWSPALNHFPVLGGEREEFPEPALNSPWCARTPKADFPKLGELDVALSETTESNKSATCVEKREANSQPDAPPDIKMKRSKKAISLDLTSIIKAKNKLPNKASRITLKHRKVRTTDTLSGNILDASMPIRKRGKVREVKKIKVTSLKMAIIKDRIIKRKTSEEISLSRIDWKKEIAEHLAFSEMIKLTPIKREANSQVVDRRLTKEAVGNVPKKIFHRKFQSYCENIVTPELNAAVKQLMQSLVSLQDHAFFRDPVRARARKRFVVGFREAAKYLKLKSVKLLILAPDLENSATDGAINNVIRDLKAQATLNEIPIVFALDRRKLGYSSLRKVPVSAFAVLNYEGLEGLFQSVLDEYHKARNEFIKKTTTEESTDTTTDQNSISQLLAKLAVNTAENENSS